MTEVPDYSGHRGVPDNNDFLRLSDLIGELEKSQAEVAEAEAALLDKKKVMVDLEQHQIPELMMALGTKSYETTSGLVVKLQETVRCSMPVANKDKCMEWLTEHGHTAMIKDTIIVSFNASEHDVAESLAEVLAKDHKHVKQEQRVEAATLRAFIKRQLEAGEDFPMEMFGAFQQQRAVVKLKANASMF